jgi:hypothetical protein
LAAVKKQQDDAALQATQAQAVQAEQTAETDPPPAPEPAEPRAPPTDTSPASNRELGREMAAERGWGPDQFNCLDALWRGESQWSVTAHNKDSGAYGIPQSLPGSKMASHGDDWRTNPVTQIAWGLDYIADRYGTPCAAKHHSDAHHPHWY